MTDEYLYPAIEPYDAGMLEVEAPHRLYYEQCGSRNGVPIVFLHGGPGSGCSPAHRRFFNPERYRVVLFDQRGAGRSQPPGCLDNNTTQALVTDLESLRAHLNIDRWLVYGGSWGATLALLYARQYAERTLGLILRGTFLARARDVVWVYGADGVARLFPREYEAFTSHLTADERAAPVTAYHRRFRHLNRAIREAAARQWHAWESRVVRQFLPPSSENLPEAEEMLRRAAIVSHFAVHEFCRGGRGVPVQFAGVRRTPCVIVHGERDFVCPLEAAWTLHRAWSGSQLRIVEAAGHVAAEPAIGQALVHVFDEMAREEFEALSDRI